MKERESEVKIVSTAHGHSAHTRTNARPTKLYTAPTYLPAQDRLNKTPAPGCPRGVLSFEPNVQQHATARPAVSFMETPTRLRDDHTPPMPNRWRGGQSLSLYLPSPSPTSFQSSSKTTETDSRRCAKFSPSLTPSSPSLPSPPFLPLRSGERSPSEIREIPAAPCVGRNSNGG